MKYAIDYIWAIVQNVLTFLSVIPLTLLGLIVVPIALRFADDSKKSATYKTNGVDEWWLRTLPTWAKLWDNPYDGFLGDDAFRWADRDIPFGWKIQTTSRNVGGALLGIHCIITKALSYRAIFANVNLNCFRANYLFVIDQMQQAINSKWQNNLMDFDSIEFIGYGNGQHGSSKFHGQPLLKLVMNLDLIIG